MRAELIKCVKMTGGRKQAAAYCGISYDTLKREMVRDPAFADSLTAAVEVCKYECVEFLRKSGKVEAVKFLLERRFSDEFGRRNANSLPIPQVIMLVNQVVAVIFQEVPAKYLARAHTNANKVLEALISAKGKATEDDMD